MAEPLSGTLGADFSKFVDECAKSVAALEAIKATSERMVGSLDQVVKATDDNAISFTKLTASYVSGQAILNAVSATWETLTGFMGDAVAAANESEAAQVKLNAALTAQGTNMPSVVAAYEQYARTLQATTTFSDDAVTAAEGVLVTIGQVMPRDMKKALDASADLAAGLGKTLPEAATMLSKAIEGNAGALKSAGINFADAGKEAVSFDQIIGAINDKFEGQASAAADTYAGKVKQLENEWSSLLTTIGKYVTTNPVVKAAIDEVTRLLGSQNDKLGDNKKAVDFVSEAVIFFAKALDTGVGAVGGFVGAALRMQSDVQLTASVIYGFVADLAEAWQTLGAMDPTGGFFTPGYEAQLVAVTQAAEGFRQRSVELSEASGVNAVAAGQWDQALGGVRSTLGDMITKLEESRDTTARNTTATNDQTGAWDRGTTSLMNRAKAQEDADKAARRDIKLLEDGIAWAEAFSAAYAKLQADYYAEVGKASANTTKAQIDNAWAAANAQIASMEKAKTLTIDNYNLIIAKANATVDNIIAKRLQDDASTIDHYQLLAAKAEEAYGFALAHSDHYTAEAINNLREQADVANERLTWWQDAANASLDNVKGTAKSTADTIGEITKKFDEASGAATRFQDAQKTSTSIAGGWLPEGAKIVGDQLIGPQGQTVNLVSAGGFLSGAKALPDNWQATYYGGLGLGGGWNAAGAKASTTVNVNAGAVTNNYPIMNDPNAMDQLGRIVGDAVMNRVTRSGALV
jgi:hypothetical protein